MPRLDRSLIAEAPAFAGLDGAALDDILAHAQSFRIPKGEVAFRQGEPAEKFFLLLHGRLRVTRLNPQGQQMVVRFINPDDMFGVAMAIQCDIYPGTATAAVDSLALSWPNSLWAGMIARYSALAVNAMRALGARLQDSQQRILDLSTQKVEQRIAGAVLQLAHQAGRPSAGGVEIDFPLSRQDIAEMTASTLHTVSRTLSAWEAFGLVECGRQRLAVRNEEGLQAIATGVEGA
ncbi:helix-turn-helix domain-containing protein [Rhodoblastus acidophilus]|uniref:Helix-turn-helix domain-containing protein n=1 Tax=Rhodoblastus acidophilus TaxID=1074 RepID=A0A6N8DL37_RHOAC|nr:Crp/Fnr family transcriptional regulator [Rhodoblastus acidophilus]MCW2273694.1 CRP-like cAMP-binding protein [Rhodoblastus acidophilus]MTV30225.1 helix-turn-helix domain-containing protein [Rhodoblastus acidophilus]